MTFPGSAAPSAGPAILRDRVPAHGVPTRHGEGAADPRPPRDRLPAQAHIHDLEELEHWPAGHDLVEPVAGAQDRLRAHRGRQRLPRPRYTDLYTNVYML